MATELRTHWSRRDFLKAVLGGTATLAGLSAARQIGLLSLPDLQHLAAAEGPPETTTIRLLAEDPALGRAHPLAILFNPPVPTGGTGRAAAAPSLAEVPGIRLLRFESTCQVPLYIAEEFLYREGFTKVEYIPSVGGLAAVNLARGAVDIGMNFSGPNIIRLEAGDPIVWLAGGHIGCFELFGSSRVRAIRDLKGKKIGIGSPKGEVEHVFLSAILSYIGLDPERDVTWVVPEREKWSEMQAESIRLLSEDKIDAYLAFPPTTLDMRAKRIGHVILKSMADRPWSQYFCCMVVAHREFVRANPVATKRALRAILMAADVVAKDPVRGAKLLAARFKDMPPSPGSKVAPHANYDYALQLMKEIPYGAWRDYNPEDTLRFYALRLREAGFIRSTPQQIIARGTDWRFLTELKKELKG